MIDSSQLLANRCEKPQLHSGVYFLFKGDEIVYIGKSINIIGRVMSHTKDKDFDTWCYIPIDELEQGPIEEMAIQRYKPKYNKQYWSTGLPYEILERIECGAISLSAVGVEYVRTC